MRNTTTGTQVPARHRYHAATVVAVYPTGSASHSVTAPVSALLVRAGWHVRRAVRPAALTALTALTALIGCAERAAVPATRASEARAACAARGGDSARGCYERALTRVSRTDGVGAAMAVLDRLAARDTAVRRFAHAYAHAIGLAAYTRPAEVGAVFARCSPAYQSGCYHGVIQAYFLDPRGAAGHAGADSARVNRLCEAYRARRREGREGGDAWLLFECTHGMGHGLTMLYGHDLPRALRGCDLLVTDDDRQACYGGAFMENVVHATTSHDPAAAHAHGRRAPESPAPFAPLDPADPTYPCSALAARYQQACWLMQTSVVLFENGRDVVATAHVCARAPAVVRRTCFVSLGRDISGLTAHDASGSRRLCETIPPAIAAGARGACHVGVVATRMQVTARAEDGLDYCRALDAAPDRWGCYHAVGRELAHIAREPRRLAEWCASVDAEDAPACRTGAGLDPS